MRESFQFKGEERKCDYFLDGSNWADFISILANLVTFVAMGLYHLPGQDNTINMNWVRLAASVAFVAMYWQLFYWLRLFSSLAQYVELILMTFSDIKYFMSVLILFLVMFFLGFMMIQKNRIEEPYIFVEQTDSGLQGLLRMYYMVLGDFGDVTLTRNLQEEGDGYDQTLIIFENTLSVIFFLGATFITQITILNMLIAIMSVTHGQHE